MKWFLNLAIRHKLFLGFGLMVGLLVLVSSTAQQRMERIQEFERQLYEAEFANAVDLFRQDNDQNAARLALLTMTLMSTRSDQDVWHKEIEARSKEGDAILTQVFSRLQKDPQVQSKLDELRSSRAAYFETRDKTIIPLIYSGKMDQARSLATGPHQELYQKIRSITDQLASEASERAKNAVELSAQETKQSIRLLFAIGGIALITSIVLVTSLNRVISTPIREVSRIAGHIASGDLTLNVSEPGRTDEVGSLLKTFKTMVENLRNLNQQIRDGVGVLASSGSEILAASTQVAASAAETASALSETTTTVEEVRQTAQLSSQKAKYVYENSQKSVQVSQNGKKAVDETAAAMSRVEGQMNAVAESITRLSEQNQAIADIISTVNDLADQSNLLAVNAAIEAAKAGEQGKGFAVVAQEVRSLAERSKEATAQIKSILNDVQKAVNHAVMSTEQGGKAVDSGVKQSKDAGESIKLLTESITEAAQAATQIAASAQQQLAGMDQVAQAMENIKQASSQNAASTKQAETAALNLNELGQKLKSLVEQYRV